jgi:hypothetical protein
MEFNTNDVYIFKGNLNLIEHILLNTNTNNNTNNNFILGKFICYITIPLHGDIYEFGKAKFDNGTINENDFKLIETME